MTGGITRRLGIVAAVTAVVAACSSPSAPDGSPARPLLGYSAAAATAQHDLERRFQQGVDAESMSALHRPLTARPHPAGSEGTREVVAYLQRTLAGYGLDVQTHEYQVLLDRPRRVEVTLTAPTRRTLSVGEPAIAGDPTSSHPELGGGYIAYSASGTASGQAVFVNYGLPADYARLKALGVSVRGHVAVARYGRSHRAVKVHTAQEEGARALVLYSDPADDGAAKGAVWPEGYWRGPDMLQRGNAKLSWFWHGDPLTPGVGATADADRLDPKTAPTLPRIPVAVVSAREAAHILTALGGAERPDAFRSGIDGAMRVGPGPAALRVDVDMDAGVRPIYDVVATLHGRATPERTILFGTHHDAWTFGGVDPGTGATALLETARGLGELARAGWRPARSIAFAFWDAEEFGLVGSTEYAEALKAQLQDQLVMYVNIDMYMKGRFDPGGVPSLRAFVADVVKDVPAGNSSVFDQWQQSEWSRLPAARRSGSVTAFEPDLKALGSGADFVPFQDHLGVPTMAIEFIGENGYGYGTYHSNYDSRAYVERVADPGFVQGVTMSQVLGTLALRMSEAEVLPFRFSPYAAALDQAVTMADGWAREAGLPIDGEALRGKAAAVSQAAAALEAAIDARLARGAVPAAEAVALNDLLARMEQRLVDDDGAADTKWYRHVFYGWNIYSLYDGQPFPGLAEAFRVKDAARVTREVLRIDRALVRLHAGLTEASALVR
ncbi:MAG: M28 family peptidase [Vicinamibacterales bacterium]